MALITRHLVLFVLLASLLATIAAAAVPLSTSTICTTTTITPSPSEGLTTTAVGTPSTSFTFTTTTITMPSSTATSFTTVTAPVPTGTTVPEYGQCGGLGYAGPTSCETPFVCVCTSAWWCQCEAAMKNFETENNLSIARGNGVSSA